MSLLTPQAPSAQQGFAPLGNLHESEETNARTRVFTGNGTSFLRVPGCSGVETIRIGPSPLPLTVQRPYVLNGAMVTEMREEALVSFQRDTDGCPVLIRSAISNDGIWQEGAPIYICGEWGDTDSQTIDDTVTPPSKPPRK